METTKQGLQEMLLRLVAAAIPVVGFLDEIGKRVDALNQRPDLRATFAHFGETLFEAVLLLPEDALAQRTLALIPDNSSDQDRAEAEAQVARFVEKLKAFRSSIGS